MLDHHPEPLTAPACGTYRLDPQRSRVHYTGKHMLGLGRFMPCSRSGTVSCASATADKR